MKVPCLLRSKPGGLELEKAEKKKREMEGFHRTLGLNTAEERETSKQERLNGRRGNGARTWKERKRGGGRGAETRENGRHGRRWRNLESVLLKFGLEMAGKNERESATGVGRRGKRQ